MLLTATLCTQNAIKLHTTSYAAVNLYQVKNLDVFFIQDISKERLNHIGEELAEIQEIHSVRFAGAEEAWDTFQKEYLTEELSEQCQTLKSPKPKNINHAFSF